MDDFLDKGTLTQNEKSNRHICWQNDSKQRPCFTVLHLLSSHLTHFWEKWDWADRSLNQSEDSICQILCQILFLSESSLSSPKLYQMAEPCSNLAQILLKPRSNLAQTLLKPRSNLTQTSLKPHSNLAKISLKPRSKLVQSLLKPHSNLSQTLLKPCSNLAQTSLKPCANLFQISFKSCSNLVQTSFWSRSNLVKVFNQCS